MLTKQLYIGIATLPTTLHPCYGLLQKACHPHSPLSMAAGTLDQRITQLRESYEFVVACNGMPPFRATKVQRQQNGRMMELLSWPSGGPQEDKEGQLQGGSEFVAQPEAAAVLAAAGNLDVGCRLVLGGEGWQGPHLHGQGGIRNAAGGVFGLAASSLLGSVTCGGAHSDGGYGSDGDEVGGAASPSPPAPRQVVKSR